MSETRLYLFDDARARNWAPFTLTRPVGELRYGCLTLRERAERVLELECSGHITRKALAGFDEPGAAPAAEFESVPRDAPRVLLSSRVVIEAANASHFTSPGRLTIGDRTVGWVLAPGDPLPPESSVRRPSLVTTGPATEIAGEILDGPWNLVAGTPRRIAADIAWLFPEPDDPHGIVRIGKGPIFLGEGAEIEPGVFVDTRGGPARLESGARVEGPARLIGPLHVGPSTTILGGTVGTSSIGPVCRVRGEVADSVILGFVNKAHDGYLGHALVGRWVNLGAFTTNSDLKNNYGTVRVWTPEGEEDTGLIKVGCFLGDHVKTGIGTVLTTGAVIGAGCNVFGGAMPPKLVPPFSWGAGADLRDYRLDHFIQAAERSMARRGEALTPGVRGILLSAWQGSRARRAG